MKEIIKAILVLSFSMIVLSLSAAEPKQYVEQLSYGIKVTSVYDNGYSLVTIFTPCTVCGGSGICFGCSGNGFVYRNGVTYSCAACFNTGKCMACKDYGGYAVASSQAYDPQGNPVYFDMGVASTIDSSSSSGSSQGSSSKKCRTCNGTGIGQSTINYAPDYTGNAKKKYCDRCKEWGFPHVHIDKRCTVCGGTGHL